ncbi:hypothetical protein KI387_016410, partial [Taxus chinensis]
ESCNCNPGCPSKSVIKEIPSALRGGQNTAHTAKGQASQEKFCGGVDSSKATASNPASFKEIVKKKSPCPSPSPAYIVDLDDDKPLLSLDNPELLA